MNQLIDKDSISLQENKDVLIIPLQTVYLFEEENNDEPRPLGANLKYDSVFSIKDSAYYKNQEKIALNFKLDTTKIKRKLQYATEEDLHHLRQLTENGKKDFWAEFHAKFGNKCFRKFSAPFFNKEKTICMVQNSISCGYLSGSGYTAIYKKIKGQWVEVEILDQWIS
ncbi:hypothetical protein JET18_11080 [Chryseobacterium sp. L7]|uniref:Uncharacterized protein n=1 Tax=Chryseobacterium endalhagicum TaxID=2797638 RepID=A0ABS1QGE3_9FLAO|nr:hypothetical protein [Chryseobacterium endalhagicum]MBL1221387.1 hypothetical protein [Chryseobacterium endalhagicum]